MNPMYLDGPIDRTEFYENTEPCYDELREMAEERLHNLSENEYQEYFETCGPDGVLIAIMEEIRTWEF